MDILDKIKGFINEKKEESKLKKNIKAEARIEALEELKPRLKEKYKEDILQDLTGEKSKARKEKIAGLFKGTFSKENFGDVGEKINRMTGKSNSDRLSMMTSTAKRIPYVEVMKDNKVDKDIDIKVRLNKMLNK